MGNTTSLGFRLAQFGMGHCDLELIVVFQNIVCLRDIAVFQDIAVLPDIAVLENIAVFCIG